MKTINKKILKVFSSGSIAISYTILKEQKKIKFQIKDYRSVSLTKNSTFFLSKTFLNNKKKYF